MPCAHNHRRRVGLAVQGWAGRSGEMDTVPGAGPVDGRGGALEALDVRVDKVPGLGPVEAVSRSERIQDAGAGGDAGGKSRWPIASAIALGYSAGSGLRSGAPGGGGHGEDIRSLGTPAQAGA